MSENGNDGASQAQIPFKVTRFSIQDRRKTPGRVMGDVIWLLIRAHSAGAEYRDLEVNGAQAIASLREMVSAIDRVDFQGGMPR
jgi:hypothetical protein